MSNQLFIIDTNVVVAGLITSQLDSPTAQILDAMLNGAILYLLSPALLTEYQRVLSRPKLIRLHGLSSSQIDVLLTELTANAIWREPANHLKKEAPDPGDNHLWQLLSCDPKFILVTGDKLLIDNPPSNCSVISVMSCIQLLRA